MARMKGKSRTGGKMGFATAPVAYTYYTGLAQPQPPSSPKKKKKRKPKTPGTPVVPAVGVDGSSDASNDSSANSGGGGGGGHAYFIFFITLVTVSIMIYIFVINKNKQETSTSPVRNTKDEPNPENVSPEPDKTKETPSGSKEWRDYGRPMVVLVTVLVLPALILYTLYRLLKRFGGGVQMKPEGSDALGKEVSVIENKGSQTSQAVGIDFRNVSGNLRTRIGHGAGVDADAAVNRANIR
jgi:hypothetical protein